MSAAAAGTLPDVDRRPAAGPGLADVQQRPGRHRRRCRRGPQTSARRRSTRNALQLTTSDEASSSRVPCDAWPQLLRLPQGPVRQGGPARARHLRQDRQAAQTLHTGDLSGISLATDPSDVFTQQSFEDLALANGCQLVDAAGKVDPRQPGVRARVHHLRPTSPHNYGAAGTQNVDSTRATYFAGQSAMIVWSTYLLDELAGLRNDAPPSCPQCKADPAFLAEEHRHRHRAQGPGRRSSPPQFGEISSWAVTKDGAETAAAEKFVAVHDERRATRAGSAWRPRARSRRAPAPPPSPDKYTNGWRGLQIGVDTKKPLDQRLPAGRARPRLLAGVDNMQRWGITEGQGALVGATDGAAAGPQGHRRHDRRPTDSRRRPPSRRSATSRARRSRSSEPLDTAIDREQRTDRAPRAGPEPVRPRRSLTLSPAREQGRAGVRLRPRCSWCWWSWSCRSLWTVLLAFQQARLVDLQQHGLFGHWTFDNFTEVFTSPGLLDLAVDHAGLHGGRHRRCRSRWGWSPHWPCADRSAAGACCAARCCCPTWRRWSP